MESNSAELSFNFKRNSFNFIRLALAILVIVAHSFELGGFGYDPVYYFSGEVYSIGALAVDGFFSISGILIIASYKNINSFGVFLWHRVLRIFPGYWLCIILTAALLPAIFDTTLNFKYAVHNTLQPAESVFQAVMGLLLPIVVGWAPNLANVAVKIHLFGQVNMPGIFSDQAVNGSLWSLVHEVRLYCLIGILGLMGFLRKPIIIIILVITWLAYSYALIKNPGWHSLANASSFRTTAHFLMGSLFYMSMPTIRHTWALIALIISVIALSFKLYPLVSPLTTTYLMVYLATVLPLYKFGVSNDLSYGLYIYAFPIQKTLTGLSVNNLGLPVYFIASILFSFAFAVISWYGIERHALKLKKFKFSFG
jgi:peptidoglycan/LPS O-acetylase OafA/YrhL